ncbi:DsbA family protein [Candidatus Palauibacter sp.]|uniref:DsbA family protein n=1 Tax=Candidatus Palauibacter sp. TaxID=3101350 RepID=UPI003B026C48
MLAVLLFNPSGVAGRWIISKYEGWQEQRRVARHWPELTSAPSYLGPPPQQGGAVIVEFVAYDCPACKTVAPAVLEAAREQGVTVVVRHVPSERGDPASTEAALAAICAEQHGLFPEAHDALVSEDMWLETRDWVGLGVSLGVGDPESFGSCVSEDEAPRHRLARDVELVKALRIPGTPTFVSTEGLHVGTAGLASAVATADAPAWQHAPRRPSTGYVFHSAEHPDLAERLFFVVGGFFAPDSGLIVVDGTELHFVDMASGENRVVGRKGGGPEEFSHITGSFRTSEGVAVWDFPRRRVVSITHAGEFGPSRSYLDVVFNSFHALRPVAHHPGGSTVFHDGDGSDGVRDSEGRYWQRARYVAVDPGGGQRVVAEAQGHERHSDTQNDRSVLFGHRTFEAATADRFVVAETNRESISVFDWRGKQVASIPMPVGGVRLTADQIGMERASRIEELRELQVEFASDPRFPFTLSEMEETRRASQPPPANEVAPPIDALLTDFDSRLWVRDYRLPGQDSVLWRVWDIEQEQQLFAVSLDGEDTLLDARGDLVLLRRLDAFDAHHVVVTPLVTVRAEGGT